MRYDYSNKKLQNKKTGYIDHYSFWVEVAIDTLGKIAASSPEEYVLAQIWMGELVEVAEKSNKSKDIKK